MELLKAVRAGSLKHVKAALKAGAAIEDEGQPGFMLGMACFLGHADIVRELVAHGAQVNTENNAAVTAPLAMAVRGGYKEVVRTLVELGALVPDGMQVGLGEQELKAAQWVAFRDGHVKHDDGGAAVSEDVEEINFSRPSHVDTQVLEAEALRAVLGKE